MFRINRILAVGSFAFASGLLSAWLPAIQQTQTRDGDAKKPPVFRVEADLVRLQVSVTDTFDRPVLDLRPEHFEVYEDKVRQDIAFFSLSAAPLSVGIVVDSSGSMKRGYKLERAREAALHFIGNSHPEDEFFLVDFNSRAGLTLDFTSNPDRVAQALHRVDAGGRTALHDAVYLALSKLDEYDSSYRKVILLFSDGADTASLYTRRDIEEAAREADVQIYAVGICGMDVTPSARDTIRRLAEVTGGRSAFTFHPAEMVGICHNFATELHRQYTLGYRPTNQQRDGEWRKVQVRVSSSAHGSRLRVRTREGYYAPR